MDRDIEGISLEHVKEKGEMNIVSLGEKLIPEAYALPSPVHPIISIPLAQEALF